MGQASKETGRRAEGDIGRFGLYQRLRLGIGKRETGRVGTEGKGYFEKAESLDGLL